MSRKKNPGLVGLVKEQIAQSGLTIFRYSRDLFQAIPSSFGLQISTPEAPDLVNRLSKIFLYDLFPMLLCYWFYALTLLFLKNHTEKENYSITSQLTSTALTSLSYTLTSVLIFRQNIQFYAHSILLNIIFPKKINEAAAARGKIFDASVCQKKCPLARQVKGEWRALLLFFILSYMIKVLEFAPYALGVLSRRAYLEFAGKYLGLLLGFFSRVVHAGQQIGEYTLLELCDRHRVEKFNQDWELFVSYGLLHYLLLNSPHILRNFTEQTFSALNLERNIILDTTIFISDSASLIYEPLSFMVLMVMVTLVQYAATPVMKDKQPYLKVPPAVDKAKRHFYDPMMITRVLVSEIIDVLIPGVKEKINIVVDNNRKASLEKKKMSQNRVESAEFDSSLLKMSDGEFEVVQEPFEIIKKPESSFREKIVDYATALYQYEFIKLLLFLGVPPLCRNYKNLAGVKSDDILGEFYEPIKSKIEESIDTAVRLRPVALSFASVLEFYWEYVSPAQEYAGIVSFFVGLVATPFAAVFAVADPKIVQLVWKPVSYLVNLLSLSSNADSATKFVGKHSNAISELRAIFSGMPKGIVIIAIALLRNETFFNWLLYLASEIKLMGVSDCSWPANTVAAPGAPALAAATASAEVTPEPENAAKRKSPAPEDDFVRVSPPLKKSESFEDIPPANSEDFRNRYESKLSR